MSEPRPAWATEAAVDAAMAHAHDEALAGRESCGLMVGREYRRCANRAADPAAQFSIAPGVLLDAERSGLPWAVVHSHPHPLHACPSLLDMAQQQATARPWAIAPVGEDGDPAEPFWWGAETPLRPLVGRPYRHGVTDCYAVVRDWWRLERGVELPDHPREWAWWQAGPEGPDLYDRHFRAAGFEEIPAAEAGVGDCLLLQVRSSVPNHAGVLTAPGLMLHHPGGDRPHDPARLSGRTPLSRWLPHLARAVRLREAPG